MFIFLVEVSRLIGYLSLGLIEYDVVVVANDRNSMILRRDVRNVRNLYHTIFKRRFHRGKLSLPKTITLFIILVTHHHEL